MNTLEGIKEYTTVVADTGAFESIQKFKPTDATTNPSLILATLKNPTYEKILTDAVSFAKKSGSTPDEQLEIAFDKCFIDIGIEILKIVPGRVSTEVDARLSFDRDAQVNKAKKLIAIYESLGIAKERILIKLSATWEGIEAAKILESQYGVHCNLTLIFSFYQALACAEARVTLISPFVGRIYDWHKKRNADASYDRFTDPGVSSVTKIFNYFKTFGYKTQIMGASFRNTDQIMGLVGCDLLTISPALLDTLKGQNEAPKQMLSVENLPAVDKVKLPLTESEFRWQMNEDEMASDKLAEGIRAFSKDARLLEDMIKSKLT